MDEESELKDAEKLKRAILDLHMDHGYSVNVLRMAAQMIIADIDQGEDLFKDLVSKLPK